jgi:hypothetical protein
MNTDKKSIAELAYALWEARGGPHGSPQQDWFEAEQRVAARSGAHETGPVDEPPVDEAQLESFPASDPPATHIADDPPSNSDAKWTAAQNAQSA